MSDKPGWTAAKYGANATDEAKIVCCGNVACFDGAGCDPARWWTFRMKMRGYRLVPALRLARGEG